MNCSVCNRTVKVGQMGYVHENGGMYVQQCAKCGWTGETEGSYRNCPNCGNSKDLRDDHVVRISTSMGNIKQTGLKLQ